MPQPIGVVYVIVNCANGKTYVGQTVQGLETRIRQHRGNQESPIGRAMRKWGMEYFAISEVYAAFDQLALDVAETALICEHDCVVPKGYNINLSGGRTGKRHPDSIEKTAARLRGRPKSPEHAKHCRTIRLGCKQPPEMVEKVAAMNRGRKHTDEARERMSANRRALGWSPLPEHQKQATNAAARANIANSATGYQFVHLVRGKFRVRISFVPGGERIDVGTFQTIEKALEARYLANPRAVFADSKPLPFEILEHPKAVRFGGR